MTEKRCQKFTPIEYVDKLLNDVDYMGNHILKKYFLENSCGPGNIMCIAVERYIVECKKNMLSNDEIKKDLGIYFIGFEIDIKIARLCHSNLDQVVASYGIYGVNWNIKMGDYLKYHLDVKADFIVGNPPYIRYQELLKEERGYLKANYYSCSSGKFDYCYAFIEKSLNDLSEFGKMGYLIPSSIFKNTFGLKIRKLMKKNLKKIIDFKHTQVFSDALTSPAMIFFDKNICNESIEYVDFDLNKIVYIEKKYLMGKWIFSDDSQKIFSVNRKNFEILGDYFKVSNSVATLKNDVYVLRDFFVEKNSNSLFFNDIRIELSATRLAASPRGINLNRKERIIFPYFYKNKELNRYPEEEFEDMYPDTFEYLKSNFKILEKRKFDGKWYEYGRSQALSDLNQPKLIMSSIITEKVHVKKLSRETIPYSGFYIIPKKNLSLDYAKSVLESKDFLNYIHLIAINANGKSVRTSVKDIMNYPLNL